MTRSQFTGAMTCLTLLVVPMMAFASESSKPWMEQVKVTLGPPVVVAQTDQTDLKWGVWQFPTISEPEPGVLLVQFNGNEDKPHDSISELQPPGRYLSRDGGKTWEKSDRQYGYTSLYGPTRLCHKRNGDLLFQEQSVGEEVPKKELPPPVEMLDDGRSVRDPLQMSAPMPQQYMILKRAGGQWQKIPMSVDDPESGIVGYDPPGKDYSIIRIRAISHIVELPDGSLLGIRDGRRLGADRKPLPKWAVTCLRSTDGGRTWKFHSVLAACDENQPLNGYSEPSIDRLPDGSLLAALRTERGWEADQRTGILYLAQSYNDGLTWSKPRAVNPFGVFPRLLTLENGVTVLSFGRPGVNLLFSTDGRGERWQGLILLVNEGQRFTRTSGYTSMVATGPNRFLIAYDQFDYPNAGGEPRKTILVREITVSR